MKHYTKSRRGDSLLDLYPLIGLTSRPKTYRIEAVIMQAISIGEAA